MLMTQRAKQGVMGFSWIIVGIVIIASVVLFGNIKQESFQLQPAITSQVTGLTTAAPIVTTSTPLTIEQTLSPKIVMYSDLVVSEEDMTFVLDKQYQEAFELFRSKVYVEKSNHAKAFKKFIGDIGFSINDTGKIIDASGRSVDPSLITCHVMGFFPDKPHIKPNC
jgi:hypothetical protein